MLDSGTISCTRCDQEKQPESFYAHPASKSGLMSICKECHKASVRKNRREKAEYYKEYDRDRAFRDDRVMARKRYQQAMKKDPAAVARMRANRKAWANKRSIQRKAHIAVGNAIRDGKLIKSPCERCGTTKAICAHHENYHHPLDINWLCRDCHGIRHREINEERRNGADYEIRGFA